MDIYSEAFIKNGYRISGLYYEVRKDRHSESLYFVYEGGGDNRKKAKYYFSHNDPLSSSWMKSLDYDMPDSGSSEEAFALLQKTRTLLPIDKANKPDFPMILQELSEEDISSITKNTVALLKNAIRQRAALCYLYPLYYKALSAMYKYAADISEEAESSGNIAALFVAIKKELDNLAVYYHDARDYCDAVFIIGDSHGSLAPDMIAAIYRGYCRANGIRGYASGVYPEAAHDPSALPMHGQSWKNYLESRKEEIQSYELSERCYYLDNFYELLHVGIDLMVENQSVLRKCKLCGGYFQIKYSLSREYCTRLYGDTKAACNEYASRKSYKEKLFQHPIHQEFTKAYNRLYGRIRRGRLPTPLMDELKKLHDEYCEKYENTHKKDREAIWREYIEKNKELLA